MTEKNELTRQWVTHVYRSLCIDENAFLAKAERLLEKASGNKKIKGLILNILVYRYNLWLKRTPASGPGPDSNFVSGNGSKIHKLIFRLIYDCGGRIPEEDLLWLVRNDPTMRSTAFRYLSATKKANYACHELLRIYKSGSFVDDASFVYLGEFLLHARFKDTKKLRNTVSALLNAMQQHGEIGLHTALFVSSRFLDNDKILSIITKNIKVISGDYWLQRAVGSLSAIFIGDKTFKKYISLVAEINSENCTDVVRYNKSLTETTKLEPSIHSYFYTKNDSFPYKIYYPKLLQIKAFSKNSKIPSEVKNVIKFHEALNEDAFYKLMFA